MHQTARHTSSNAVNLVLDEKVDQRHKRGEKTSSKDLSIFERGGIVGAQGDTAYCPWQSCNKVRDHEDIVPVMVVGGGNICPSSAGQRSEDADTSNELGQGRVWATSQGVPEADECEPRTCSS
jgi:hypothetical protein